MTTANPATQHQAVLTIRILEKLSGSIDKLGARLENLGKGGGGAAGGAASRGGSIIDAARTGARDLFAGRAFGGGLPGLAAAGAATLAVGAAGVAAHAVSGGVLQAHRGGSFGAGATGALTGLAAGIPLVGELSGASAVERVTEGATADLNAITNNIARFAPQAVTGRVRNFLARQAIAQNMNVEADRQANQTLVNELQYGRGISGVLEQAKTINQMVVAAGYQQHS